MSHGGFTLIETLVSLSIFTLAIVGLVSVTASGIANTNYAKNKATASYLAQEGVELVRSIRDADILAFSSAGTNWSEFLTEINPCTTAFPYGCLIVKFPAAPSGLRAVACTLVAQNQVCGKIQYDDNGYYGYGLTQNPVNSIFTRIITVNRISNAEVQVVSTVSWPQANISATPFQVTYTENLFNWQ